MTTPESIEMVVAATAQHVRAARLVAASMASDLGFDVERLEDVRVAIDELCTLFSPDNDSGTIELRIRAVDGNLDVRGSYRGEGTVTEPDWLVTEILDATTDELELPSRENPTFWFCRHRGG